MRTCRLVYRVEPYLLLLCTAQATWARAEAAPSYPKGDDEWGTAAPNLYRRGEPDLCHVRLTSRGRDVELGASTGTDPNMFAAQRPVCAQEKRAREDSESMSE